MANQKPDLKPDRIATALGGAYPEIPHGYVSFKGYLAGGQGDVDKDGGAAKEDDVRRLYLTDTFWRWLEVKTIDIAERLDVPDNEKDSRSVIWVKRDAKVVQCQVGLAHEVEEEVWGTVDPAGGGGGRHGRPPY